MAMLETEHVLTIYYPHKHLLLGQMKDFFFLVEDLQFYYMLKLWVCY